jgi:hypothetical protein
MVPEAIPSSRASYTIVVASTIDLFEDVEVKLSLVPTINMWDQAW